MSPPRNGKLFSTVKSCAANAADSVCRKILLVVQSWSLPNTIVFGLIPG